MWKWLLGVFLAFVLVCGGGGLWLGVSETGRGWMKSMGGQAETTEVRLEKVARGELVRTVNAPGTIEPKTNVKVSAQVSAKIVALPFREGDTVKQGDVVVRLDSVDLAARLESTEAEMKGDEARLEGARASFENMKLELERQRNLFGSKDVSKADLERSEAEYRRADASLNAARFAIEVARANIARARKDLDNTVITAPMDGRIVKLNVEVGETVLGTFNNAGTELMEIADLGVMMMTAKVDESNIAPVRENQIARVFINAYPGREFRGRVDRVGLKKLIDKDQTQYFEVEILVENQEGVLLRSGLQANTDIEVETLSGVIKVPSQAVVDRRVDELPKEIQDINTALGQKKAYARVVYRTVPVDDAAATNGNGAGQAGAGERKVVATPVVVGSSDLTHTVVLAGLEEGAELVIGPYKALVAIKHEQRVIDEVEAHKRREQREGKKSGDASKTAAGEKQPESKSGGTGGSGNSANGSGDSGAAAAQKTGG